MRLILYIKVAFGLIFNPPNILAVYNYLLFQLNRVLKREFLPYTPVSIVLSTTKRCNFTCSFCFVKEYLEASKESDLTIDQFEKLVQHKYFKRALRVGLLGGEPFLNENTHLFISKLKKMGKIVTVVSNASLIDETCCDRIKKSKLDALGLSLYDNNHDDIRRVVMALSGKVNLWVQTIVRKNALERIEDAISICLASGAKHLILDNLLPIDDETRSQTLHDDPEVMNHLNELKAKYNSSEYKRKISITWPPLVPRNERLVKKRCQQPMSYIQLDNVGRIGACCVRYPQEEFGTIYDKNSWNTKWFQEIRRSMYSNEAFDETCRNCQCLYEDLYKV